MKNQTDFKKLDPLEDHVMGMVASFVTTESSLEKIFGFKADDMPADWFPGLGEGRMFPVEVNHELKFLAIKFGHHPTDWSSDWVLLTESYDKLDSVLTTLGLDRDQMKWISTLTEYQSQFQG